MRPSGREIQPFCSPPRVEFAGKLECSKGLSGFQMWINLFGIKEILQYLSLSPAHRLLLSPAGKWNLRAFIDRFHLGKPVATLQFVTQNYQDWRSPKCLKVNVDVFRFAVFKELWMFVWFCVFFLFFFKISRLLLPLSYRREISSLCYNIWQGFDAPLPPPTHPPRRSISVTWWWSEGLEKEVLTSPGISH